MTDIMEDSISSSVGKTQFLFVSWTITVYFLN